MRHTGLLHLLCAHACNGRGCALARAYEWAGFLAQREADGPNVNTGRKKLDEKFVRRNFISLLLGIDIDIDIDIDIGFQYHTKTTHSEFDQTYIFIYIIKNIINAKLR